MGNVTHFLGIRFQWRQSQDSVSVDMSQQAFTEQLIASAGLDLESATTKPSPFRSGLPIDSLPYTTLSPNEHQSLQTQLRSYIGSLLWLAQVTRPDLAVIANLLSQRQNQPSTQLITAAKHIIKYLKGTSSMGISFHTHSHLSIKSFIHFPIDTAKIFAVSDANWGPQDQSVLKPNSKQQTVPLTTSRSISGHMIFLHGPLHWSAKRQSITARSTAESEIYATDQCVKDILHLSHIIKDLNLTKELLNQPTKIFNDNMACVQWSNNRTNRNIRHIQIRENATRESVQNKTVTVQHVDGKTNPADIFTKEQNDVNNFLALRDIISSHPFPDSSIIASPSKTLRP